MSCPDHPDHDHDFPRYSTHLGVHDPVPPYINSNINVHVVTTNWALLRLAPFAADQLRMGAVAFPFAIQVENLNGITRLTQGSSFRGDSRAE
jgi:hypothetical protein